MYEGLFIVLLPMLLGYSWKINNPTLQAKLTKLSIFLLYAILCVMGISLGQLENLTQLLPQIGFSALIFAFFTQGFNLIALFIFDKTNPQPLISQSEEIPPRWKMLLDSGKLCCIVLLGFILGFYTKGWLNMPFGTSSYILVVLIFSVGLQLRNSGISVREVFFNKRGMVTGFIFALTSLLGGVVASILLKVSIIKGLAVGSGFGWYSLSSVILNEAWGPVWGSIGFFNDLSREIVSLFIIPIFMQKYRSTAVGYTGATAIDCTLPIIQRAGGLEVVPLAISFGFITNILPPLLLVFFTSVPI